MKKRYIKVREIQDMVASLCTSITLSKWQPELIVGIGRGGLVPAVMMSHYFNIPMLPLHWSTRDFPSTESNLWMPEDVIKGKKTLIVDDILDTGESMKQIMQDWEDSVIDELDWGETVRIAVLQKKCTCPITPDYYAELLSDDIWQAYPWEVWHESIKT